MVPRKQFSAFVHQPYHTLPGNRRLVPYLHSGSGYAAHDSHLRVPGEKARQRGTETRDPGSGDQSRHPRTTRKRVLSLFCHAGCKTRRSRVAWWLLLVHDHRDGMAWPSHPVPFLDLGDFASGLPWKGKKHSLNYLSRSRPVSFSDLISWPVYDDDDLNACVYGWRDGEEEDLKKGGREACCRRDVTYIYIPQSQP